ncbi:maleylpyruvate isomerase family mycothiol-dependent enzyme [Actinoplanes sp. TRM 88003]|uniref:Maleylpyruvate isomerase family mycothiol-dependent enzyme n=1 Tax=Paractinoplanes aksuensis TaxID=2939490 RepID=A0ABT1DYZ4_9ACTN|nr:maleylpyruvate isomerase family mycothiol-dependent enzyme [Actinoplanes aksuensis]MCO8276110.1 maleylpyruvate isomerase family mycothiol-dependent enzyme [Actinoplanes aksuensis]
MEWLAPERYAAELEAEAGRLGAAAARLPIATIVPSCPEWTVHDLVTHVGSGHRYAADVLEAGGPVEYERVGAPSDPDVWTPWLLDGAQRLNAAVVAVGFSNEAWTWHPRHQTAGFWQRRMVHDEVVHRFDADPDGELAPDLAADGVSDLLLSFKTFETMRGDGETLQFSATDVPRSWHVTLTSSGITWDDGDRGADVTVTAPVLELLLTLNRRRATSQPAGDAALWERWLAASRF